MEHPPPLARPELIAGERGVSELLEQKFSTDTLEILYYPLRQVPLPSFIAETLVWQSDTLKLFGENAVQFGDLEPVNDTSKCEILGYKRSDAYTVLCLVRYGSNFGLFTNEINQTSWELIGLFNIKGNIEPPGFTSYDEFEEKYILANKNKFEGGKDKENKEEEEEKETEADDGEDSYWNQYDKVSDEDTGTQEEKNDASNNNNEDDYWNSYDSRQTHQIEDAPEAQCRPEAMCALSSLVDLYKDCGVTDKNLIADDLLAIGLNFPASDEIPMIAHKHGVRTWEWVKDADTSMAELMAVFNKIKFNL